jgi:HPt (histidine-containing phosphotransfer) domain-containing protein
MPQANLFDPLVLEGLRQFGSGDFVDQMVDLFLQSTRSVPADLESQAETGDWKAVAFSAHSLKSGAGNLGLIGLTDSAGAMEAAARDGDAERLREIIQAMPALYERSCAVLKEYLIRP